MPFSDLQDFIRHLESKNEIRRIKVPVSQDLEIAEITDRVTKSYGPALLFENVTGHTMPVAINLFGTKERMALGLDVGSLDKLPELLTEFISMAMDPPKATNFLEKLKLLPKLAEIANFMPKQVNDGICKEVIWKEDKVDLNKFPILKCWPEDGGRYITYPLVFTHDPVSRKRNCGTYRLQVVDSKSTMMHFHPHKDAARHFRKAQEAGAERLEIACVIGSDPAMCFSSVLPLPPDMDEVLFAGLVKRDGMKMVKCETLDIQVPANAEIVLEGYLDTKELRLEGPFGDHTGYYSLEEKFPVFHVQCITQRKNPVYHTTIVGVPPQEDAYIGYAIERLLLPVMKLHLPEIVDYYMPPEGCFNNLMIVSIKKQYPGHGRKVMHAIWGLGQAMFTKCIVVVDEDIDVHNTAEVVWRALANIDPQRDIEFVMGPLDILDHASRGLCYGSKIGIDATRKVSDEGFTRRWPDVIRMSPEIKAIVDKKWSELGL